MIQVNVRANTTRRTINCEVTSTPAEVFSSIGCDTSSSMVNLNGNILYAAEFQKTFQELGVADGTQANLNAIVKADGAAE